ncbi:sigma-54-dependent Fis family transcriptional regulator [Azospirillum halopraeferens]|uniref:sigma-54-dependent Fis family transcriptional regulator n=1 Tax=Azospirillum halopraeferens TaxID=34010 RepID=UPI000423B879|nr:sigma-54-dependent Fis family transcriptional regulator [Azospirillum halopraeferens]
MSRDRRHLLENLRRACSGRHTLLVGAAIGTGMAARAAARGGADFLLALAAGRLRTMGTSSIATMLALKDTNAFVADFACSEIVGATDTPVFFGAGAWGIAPADLAPFMERLRDRGFAGVVNFPTVAHVDGRFREALEGCGLGFAGEARMLAAARAAGLATVGYFRRKAEALMLADAGIDIYCFNIGWNAGGALGVPSRESVLQAGNRARGVIKAIRTAHPGALCVIEGGPITTPQDMHEACREARADGYIGGSTIDRLPSESSIEEMTSAFKLVSSLQRRIDRLERRLDRDGRAAGLIGRTEAMVEARTRLEHLAADGGPVWVAGPEGSGRSLVASLLHARGPRRQRQPVTVDARRLEADWLFGAEPGEAGGRRRQGWVEVANGTTLIVTHAEHLAADVQAELAAFVDNGVFRRRGGHDSLRSSAKMVLVGTAALGDAARDGALIPELAHRLAHRDIQLVPLRERLDDIPLLVERFAAALRPGAGPVRLTPAAFRRLITYDWPGNLRELRAVVEQALHGAGDVIDAGALPPLDGARPSPARSGPDDGRAEREAEREWLLDGLRRHRFRRGETARFLGLSRKTLYNRMRLHGLLD